MENDIQIVDNFFSKSYQQHLYDFLTGKNTTWYFQDNISYPTKTLWNDFIATDDMIYGTSGLAFYLKKYEDNVVSGQHKEILDDFIISIEKHFKLKVNEIIRCRAMYMSPYKKKENSYNGPHIDFPDPHKTLIYYVNDSDGDTYFFEEKSLGGEIDPSKKTICKTVSPKQGRAVLFDGYRYHSGTNPTKNSRILLNLNFT